MTLLRRAAAIETSLSPTQLVLRWMADAHSYGSVERYVASLLECDPPANPLDHLAREAVQGAQVAMRGKRPEVIAEAVRSALRETVFRFELVLRINMAANELLEHRWVDAALAARIGLVVCGQDRDPKSARLVKVRDYCLDRADGLCAEQDARSLVERRYLEGNAALFPQVAAVWVQQVGSTQLIVEMVERFAALAPASRPPERESSQRRTAELVSSLVEPAKAETLDKLGEGRQSLALGARWVRSRLTPPAPVDGDLDSPGLPNPSRRPDAAAPG